MAEVKIMPCLDMKDGRVVKGVNFINLVDAGDRDYSLLHTEQMFSFLDITAAIEKKGRC